MSHPAAEQLQQLIDQRDIEALAIRYADAIDRKDYSILDECFTADAVLDFADAGGPTAQYTEIRQWLETALEPLTDIQHFICNHQIKLEGDSASGECYNLNISSANNVEGAAAPHLVIGSRYVDKYSRTAAGWRIVQRKQERIAFATVMPPSNG